MVIGYSNASQGDVAAIGNDTSKLNGLPVQCAGINARLGYTDTRMNNIDRNRFKNVRRVIKAVLQNCTGRGNLCPSRSHAGINSDCALDGKGLRWRTGWYNCPTGDQRGCWAGW